MTTNSHTPGPWTIKGVHIGNGKPENVRAETIEPNICEMSSSRAPDDVTANARLIAAAPALLEALKDLIRAVEDESRDEGLIKEHVAHDTILKAMSAIAQAEGRQP